MTISQRYVLTLSMIYLCLRPWGIREDSANEIGADSDHEIGDSDNEVREEVRDSDCQN